MELEYEVRRRPHTVGAIPKAYARSETLVKLLKQINDEAKGPIEKPKPPQKNFLKENLRQLKDIQARAKEKLAEKQPLQPLRVPNKYSQAQAKVFRNEALYIDKSVPRSIENIEPPKTAGPFRNHHRPSSPGLSSRHGEHHNLHTYKSLPHLNQRQEAEQDAEIFDKDFRSQKRYNLPAKTSNSTKMKKDLETKSEGPHRLGQIPNYLTERKKQWEVEREKQLKLLEEASVPAGYTLLPDEERVETLELLKKNQEELIRSLAILPVRNDTVRIRNHKEELERQLAKVEEGIKIFSRPKVLIKNDS